MPPLVLTSDQAHQLSVVEHPIEVLDDKGQFVGVLQPYAPCSEEDIAAALRSRNSDQPRYTTAQVLEYLRSLDKSS